MASNIRINKICQHCGNAFVAKTTSTKYCQHRCSSQAYKKRKRLEKLEASNQKTVKTLSIPMEELKAKEFLTVREVAKLLSCSVRSVYYQIEHGQINAVNLSERMTRVKRSEIDRLFEQPQNTESTLPETTAYQIEDCYLFSEVYEKYGISDKALYDLMKRKNIPKLKKGWYGYVPKAEIHKYLGE